MKETLHEIAERHGTDKASHGYCPFYETHLGRLRDESIRLLEIGVLRGASLRTWRDYFSAGSIVGADINDVGDVDGMKVYQTDASKSESLRELASHGKWDVIVDDAGHTMRQQQLALDVMWDALELGGIYVLEDLHSSFDGGCNPHGFEASTFSLVCALRDGVKFSSPELSAERFEQIRSQVESIDMWIRIPQDDPRGYRRNNSMTSVIRKKTT